MSTRNVKRKIYCKDLIICIFKNKKMPGHMGDVSRTTQNLDVVKVMPEKNLLLVKGSIPGHKGSILSLRIAKKAKIKG